MHFSVPHGLLLRNYTMGTYRNAVTVFMNTHDICALIPKNRGGHMNRIFIAIACAAFSFQMFGQDKPKQEITLPRPGGLYVMDDVSNERPANAVYVQGLTTSPAYLTDITGHAIYVPIAKILPSITTWGKFDWTWGYLDSLVQMAVSHNKKFSIELETGFQISSTYVDALPSGFLKLAGSNCAPLFDVWETGGSGGRGISAYVPLPWVPKVQELWSSAAVALAAHLQQTGVYRWLTLVHIPGLSVYDEELRLPTGYPRPATTDTSVCPDGRLASTAVVADADTGRWRSLGYSDSAVVAGFTVIAAAFAQAFPDRYLGLSLFPLGAHGIDFPNLTSDTAGYVTSQIVMAVTKMAPGRVQIQSDNLDINLIDAEVTALASLYEDGIGWQTNKHASTGAGCNGGSAGSCSPDGSNGPFFQLLKAGWENGGRYMEIWSSDVVSYPQSIAAALNNGFFTVTSVPTEYQDAPMIFSLEQNYPNPFNPATTIRFTIAAKTDVKLRVYDVLGRLVKTLMRGEMNPGSHDVVWGGTDDAGRIVAGGIYFVMLQAGVFTQVRSMHFLK
jgi:hypothetical protein